MAKMEYRRISRGSVNIGALAEYIYKAIKVRYDVSARAREVKQSINRILFNGFDAVVDYDESRNIAIRIMDALAGHGFNVEREKVGEHDYDFDLQDEIHELILDSMGAEAPKE